jgi:hypothetical protein
MNVVAINFQHRADNELTRLSAKVINFPQQAKKKVGHQSLYTVNKGIPLLTATT